MFSKAYRKYNLINSCIFAMTVVSHYYLQWLTAGTWLPCASPGGWGWGGGGVISKWTVTTVHCQWTGIEPDSQNFIWISWKQILVFLPFTEAQNYILFYVENHLTKCNGSFYRRIFYQHRLTSLTLENSCMDRSWRKRANLELNKSSGKLFCFRIRIPRIGYYNTWMFKYMDNSTQWVLEGKTRKMSKMVKLTIGELFNVNPVNSLLKAFIGDFE